MTDINLLIKRYSAVWNESEPARRHELVAEVWTAEAHYVTRNGEHIGAESIEAAVTKSYDDFLSKGFQFILSSEVDSHHNVVRVPWRMVRPGADEAVAAGEQFLIFNEDGLITSDHQFITLAPPAP